MIYAVIDTNVFVSSFLTRHDDAATLRVIAAMGSGKYIPLYCDEILSEYRDVLSRPKFGITPAVVDALIDKVRQLGKEAQPTESCLDFPDVEDRVFYEVALTHTEDGARLVTGNAKHFPKSPIVVSAAEFCEMIGV